MNIYTSSSKYLEWYFFTFITFLESAAFGESNFWFIFDLQKLLWGNPLDVLLKYDQCMYVALLQRNLAGNLSMVLGNVECGNMWCVKVKNTRTVFLLLLKSYCKQWKKMQLVSRISIIWCGETSNLHLHLSNVTFPADFSVLKDSLALNSFMHNVVKWPKCSHRKTFKVCLTILQHYSWQG